MSGRQSTGSVLMVRPWGFGFNPDAARTNAFQHSDPADGAQAVAARAREEFDRLERALIEAGVDVHTFEEAESARTPDAVYPNNWVSFHDDGTVVLYPMAPASRRAERRPDIIDELEARGFSVEAILDLTRHERVGRALEGTGSMVFDQRRRRIYAALSDRTSPELLHAFGRRMGYDVLPFETRGAGGKPIYHTNVLLAIGTDVAVVCAEVVPDVDERARLLESLAADRPVIEITREQMASFCGNILELETSNGGRCFAMSSRAYAAFTEEQREQLATAGTLVHSDVSTIERVGGGGVRCMLAEIALPRE